MKRQKLFLALVLCALVTIGALSAHLAWAEAAPQAEAASQAEPVENAEPTPKEQEETEPTPPPVEGKTMYTKKNTYLYKGKKASSKGAVKVPKHEMVEVIDPGKKWSKAVYDGRTGYFKTSDLIAELPEPTPAPEPTPEPRHRTIPLPKSEGETLYAGQASEVSVTAAQLITALILDHHALGDGYFGRIHSLVNTNLDAILAGNVPSALSEYADTLSAAASDLKGGMTLDLLGQALNAKRKEGKFFTQSGVVAASALTKAEDGTLVFALGSHTVASGVAKGSYFLQMPLSKVPALKALYPGAETLTALLPVKAARMSGGGGGGGGGGGSGKQLPVARLILKAVHTEPALPKAGEAFDIVLTLANTSEQMYLRNLQLTYTSAEDALQPVSGANIEYIDRIDAGADYPVRLHVKAKPDLEMSAVKLDVAVDFQDKKLDALTAALSATVNVEQVQRIQLDAPVLPTGEVVIDDEYEVEMGVFNLGKTDLHNVTVRAVPEDPAKLSPGTSYFIGKMEPGGMKVAQLKMTPHEAGEYKVDLVVTYETVDGKESQDKQSITFAASSTDPMDMELEGDPYGGPEVTPEPERPSTMAILGMLPWQIYAGAGALVAFIIIMIGVSARRKRMRALEDDEMD